MKVEVLHVRDPDSECALSVFVDGKEVDFVLEDVDAGRGYDSADWESRIVEAREDEAMSPAFREATLEALGDPPGSKYIT